MSESNSIPVVALLMGDPSGVGPEIILKAIQQIDGTNRCHPLLVGQSRVFEDTASRIDMDIKFRAVNRFEDVRMDDPVMDVLEAGDLQLDDLIPGQPSAAGGRAQKQAIHQADELVREGKIDGIVMGPISEKAMAMSAEEEEQPTGLPFPEKTYTLLMNQGLRVVHLFGHVPIAHLSENLSRPAVLDVVKLIHRQCSGWGLSDPSIGVSGLNPHAKGTEEEQIIQPTVEEAAREGIHIEGPLPPDTVFRKALNGHFDVVLAMYHDQGHIAIKTTMFEGNMGLLLGLPYVLGTVGHGPAFDLAGTGEASAQNLMDCLQVVSSLLQGKGFPAGS